MSDVEHNSPLSSDANDDDDDDDDDVDDSVEQDAQGDNDNDDDIEDDDDDGDQNDQDDDDRDLVSRSEVGGDDDDDDDEEEEEEDGGGHNVTNDENIDGDDEDGDDDDEEGDDGGEDDDGDDDGDDNEGDEEEETNVAETEATEEDAAESAADKVPSSTKSSDALASTSLKKRPVALSTQSAAVPSDSGDGIDGSPKKKKRVGRKPPSATKSSTNLVTGLSIPFRTIKKAMKLDPDILIVQNEAALVVTKAAEMFLENLAMESLKISKNHGRNTIRYEDVAEARSNDASKAFLKTILP